jgi:hypothetical protein
MLSQNTAVRFLISIVLLVTLAAADYPNDNGWQNLPWSGTKAEVQRTISGVQEIQPDLGIPAKHSKNNAFFVHPGMKLYLPDYDLDGEPATVIFSFDSSDKLDEVTVNGDDWRTQHYADRIFLALKTKYGDPGEHTIKEEPLNHEHVQATWINKNTVITFSTIEVNHDGEIDLSITYQRGPVSASGKI